MAYCRLARPRVNTRTDEKKFNPLTVNCSVADPDPVLGSRTSKKNVNRSRAFLFYPLPWTLVLTEEDRTRSCSTNSDKFPNIFGGRYRQLIQTYCIYCTVCVNQVIFPNTVYQFDSLPFEYIKKFECVFDSFSTYAVCTNDLAAAQIAPQIPHSPYLVLPQPGPLPQRQ